MNTRSNVGDPRSAGVGIRDKLRLGQMDRLPGGVAVVPVPPMQLTTDLVTDTMITNHSPCWTIEAPIYEKRFYRVKPCQ